MLAQKQTVLRHFFVDEQRKLKQVAASVIGRNDKLRKVLSNGFKAAEKSLPLRAFHIIFDQQLFCAKCGAVIQ